MRVGVRLWLSYLKQAPLLIVLIVYTLVTGGPFLWVATMSVRTTPEIFDDRYGARSTILTSQLEVEHWHDQLGEATVADAICDRLLHNAHRIALKGPSWRKGDAQLDA